MAVKRSAKIGVEDEMDIKEVRPDDGLKINKK